MDICILGSPKLIHINFVPFFIIIAFFNILLEFALFFIQHKLVFVYKIIFAVNLVSCGIIYSNN